MMHVPPKNADVRTLRPAWLAAQQAWHSTCQYVHAETPNPIPSLTGLRHRGCSNRGGVAGGQPAAGLKSGAAAPAGSEHQAAAA